jgi:hypothetical protein
LLTEQLLAAAVLDSTACSQAHDAAQSNRCVRCTKHQCLRCPVELMIDVSEKGHTDHTPSAMPHTAAGIT